MSDKKFTNYSLYCNFLNALAKDLTRYYYKKLNKPFKVINKSGGKNFDLISCLNDNDDHIKMMENIVKTYIH